MATHFVGVGDTFMEDPDIQDIDNTSQDDLQDENIVQNLLCKTACLRQAVENRDNRDDPTFHLYLIHSERNNYL